MNEGGTTVPFGSSSVNTGNPIQIEAFPNASEGYSFENWSTSDPFNCRIVNLNNNPNNVTVNANCTITANFVLNKLILISAGSGHNCYILSNGSVKCRGNNNYGQLGVGVGDTTYRSAPTQVYGMTSGTQVSVGISHTCALQNGSIMCWGRNDYGQLGDGTTTDSTVPIQVNGLANGVTSISAGYLSSCAIQNGIVKCWGSNNFGQLGNGTTNNSTTPVTVTGINDAITVFENTYGTCAILSSGAVKCWGDSGISSSLTPVDVSGIDGINSKASSIGGGISYFCALLDNGTIKCWGSNNFGQLGNGTTNNSITPVTVTGISDAIAISGSHNNTHECIILGSGSIMCWGRNNYGQLGDGTQVDHSTPVEATTITGNAISVDTGFLYTCAVLDDGTENCWGRNI